MGLRAWSIPFCELVAYRFRSISVTVIAKRFLDSFSLVLRRPLSPSERYSAANDGVLNESRKSENASL